MLKKGIKKEMLLSQFRHKASLKAFQFSFLLAVHCLKNNCLPPKKRSNYENNIKMKTKGEQNYLHDQTLTIRFLISLSERLFVITN